MQLICAAGSTSTRLFAASCCFPAALQRAKKFVCWVGLVGPGTKSPVPIAMLAGIRVVRWYWVQNSRVVEETSSQAHTHKICLPCNNPFSPEEKQSKRTAFSTRSCRRLLLPRAYVCVPSFLLSAGILSVVLALPGQLLCSFLDFGNVYLRRRAARPYHRRRRVTTAFRQVQPSATDRKPVCQ